jgi:ethanolamine utilization protein EutA (predicted chaperonin)
MVNKRQTQVVKCHQQFVKIIKTNGNTSSTNGKCRQKQVVQIVKQHVNIVKQYVKHHQSKWYNASNKNVKIVNTYKHRQKHGQPSSNKW